MGALKYLDPFPMLVVAGVVVVTAVSATFTVPFLNETTASLLVGGFVLALLVAGGYWLRDARHEEH